MFAFLTIDLVRETIEELWPSIARDMQSRGVAEGHFTVMNPDYSCPGFHIGEAAYRESFNAAVLYRQSFGDSSKWKYPYDKIADGKCNISWYTGLPSDVAIREFPHLLRRGDTRYGGSTVLTSPLCSRPLIVAFSGDTEEDDKKHAVRLATAIAEKCKQRAQFSDDDPDFIP